VCSEIQNLDFSLLVANRYVTDWTTGPNQTLPLASHKQLIEWEGVKEECNEGTRLEGIRKQNKEEGNRE
jgi:hypothetical protein